MRSDTGDEVGQVLAGLAALTTVDVATLPDAQVRAEVLELLRALNQLQAALADRVGSFDTRGLAHADGLRSTAAWVAAFGHISKRAGLALVQRGWLLRHVPALAAGMRQGSVSAEQLARVEELVRRIGVAKVRRYDEILALLCESAGPHEVGRACERIGALEDPDGAEPDPEEDHRRRELVFGQVGRSLYVRGRLDAEGAAIVQTAIDALMRPPGAGDERTTPQRRADALVDLARLALSGDQLPSVGGDRPHVALLLTPDALVDAPPADATSERCGDPLTAAGVPELPVRPWLNWVGEVGRTTARRLACDGVIWRAILDPQTGLPLDVGRRYRIVPPWIRRALWLRDRGCRWPGCDTPAEWTDAHHVIPWWQDGTTEMRRLVSLCRYHHRLVHEGGWTVALDPATGQVQITRPNGSAYELGPSQPLTAPNPQRPSHGPAPPRPAAA